MIFFKLNIVKLYIVVELFIELGRVNSDLLRGHVILIILNIDSVVLAHKVSVTMGQELYVIVIETGHYYVTLDEYLHVQEPAVDMVTLYSRGTPLRVIETGVINKLTYFWLCLMNPCY